MPPLEGIEVSLKPLEVMGVRFEVPQKDVVDILEMGLEEVEKFKDAEVSFLETKSKELESKVSLEGDH
jgi:hypothetical protein